MASTSPPTTSSDDVNYAHVYGITKAPAIVVTVIFALFFIVCIVNAVRLIRAKGVKLVFIYLSVFTSVRVLAFLLRADVASNGTNVNLFITQQIVYAAGFFAVVNTCYSLLHQWFAQAKEFFPDRVQGFMRLLSIVAHIVLLLAVGLGIIGGVNSTPSNSESKIHSGQNLTHISRWIFLILTLIYELIAISSVLHLQFYNDPLEATNQLKKNVAILALVGIFLNIRTIFNVTSNTHIAIFYNEHLFYPLSVLPEMLVLCTLCFPGVVRRYADTPGMPKVGEA